MKLIADENIDMAILTRLRQENHQVWSVYEMKRGMTDSEVLGIANTENALLLTGDKDFGELVFRKKMISPGVILIRLSGMDNREKASIVASVIEKHHGELLKSFTVITPESVRIRKF